MYVLYITYIPHDDGTVSLYVVSPMRDEEPGWAGGGVLYRTGPGRVIMDSQYNKTLKKNDYIR